MVWFNSFPLVIGVRIIAIDEFRNSVLSIRNAEVLEYGYQPNKDWAVSKKQWKYYKPYFEKGNRRCLYTKF